MPGCWIAISRQPISTISSVVSSRCAALQARSLVEASKDFREDQIADGQRFAAKEAIQLVCMCRDGAPERHYATKMLRVA